jgi:hypothetical protein
MVPQIQAEIWRGGFQRRKPTQLRALTVKGKVRGSPVPICYPSSPWMSPQPEDRGLGFTCSENIKSCLGELGFPR